MVEGTDLPLWAMEIDPEREKDLFKEYARGRRWRVPVAEVVQFDGRPWGSARPHELGMTQVRFLT